MNTISGFQIFNPLPFHLYNPAITEIESTHRVDVHKTTGQFDSKEYDFVSFYGKDYVNGKIYECSLYLKHSLILFYIQVISI